MRISLKQGGAEIAWLDLDTSKSGTNELFYDLLKVIDREPSNGSQSDRADWARECVLVWLDWEGRDDSEPLPSFINDISVGSWANMFELIMTYVVGMTPVERFKTEEETERVAKARLEKERKDLENDFKVLSMLKFKGVTVNRIRDAASKLKLQFNKDFADNPSLNEKALDARLALIEAQKSKLGSIKRSPMPNNEFQHNGKTYVIPHASLSRFASVDLDNPQDFSNPNIKLWQFIEIEELRRIVSKLDTDDSEQIRNNQYTVSLNILAVLAREVKDREEEDWPVRKRDIRAKIEQRIEEFRDISLDVARDVDFFLSSTFLAYKMTNGTLISGKANPK